MKTLSILSLVIVMLYATSTVACAQQKTNAPQLTNQMVIPARASSTPREVAAATSAAAVFAPATPVAPKPAPAPVMASEPVASPERAFNAAFEGMSLIPAKQGDKANKPAAQTAKPDNPPKLVRNPEMIARMHAAVEQIAAEYGNPTFAQVFTNDTVQAQILRKRLQLLQRMDLITQEIAALNQQKISVKTELDVARKELAALQEQAGELSRSLRNTRIAVNTISKPSL